MTPTCAFVAAETEGVFVVDITDPDAPGLAGWLADEDKGKA